MRAKFPIEPFISDVTVASGLFRAEAERVLMRWVDIDSFDLAKPKPIEKDYFSKRDDLLNEIIALLEKAGISKKVERLESLYESDYFRDKELAPFGTDLREHQEKERDSSDWAGRRYGLRDIYFKVPERDLRLQLIVKEREFRELRLTSLVADLQGARKRLHEIETKSNSGLGVAIVGIVIVLIGASVGNLVGAIAAAVSALILGVYLFKDQQLQKEREVASAKTDVQMCESGLRKEESLQELFSFHEQLTGEPDPQP